MVLRQSPYTFQVPTHTPRTPTMDFFASPLTAASNSSEFEPINSTPIDADGNNGPPGCVVA